MAGDIREQITEWLTGAGTCYLLGAGCSVCAGKPLVGGLTTRVLTDAPAKLKEQFAGLKPAGDRPTTIEDLLTYLIRYRDILTTVTNGAGHDVSIAEIDVWLKLIKAGIVQAITDEWIASTYHRRFLQRVRNPRQGRPRDVFSLNYDTVLEATLDELRLPYVDGFRGTNRAWFDPDVFDEIGSVGPQFRIFKLHGSINWTRDANGYVRRGGKEHVTDEPIVVFPSEQKYLQTQYGVYETLMARFRNRLRITDANNYLIVLGYSFNDDHITEAICDAVTARDSNLTVVAFVGPEDEREKQIARLDAIASRCDYRFNAFIGSGVTGHFVGHALDEDAAKAVIKAEVWRFENLVTLIAGEVP
jgi:hypothetical protein